MTTNLYDKDTINKLIKYLNPERESFKEFIFRDLNGLYKYTGTYPSITKKYLDVSDNYNFENICDSLQTKEIDIKLCNKFLLNGILNMNHNEIKLVLKNIKEITDISPIFFDIAKEEIINIDHKIIISLLKNLDFKILEDYNDNLNKYVRVIESIPNWLDKINNDNKKIILKIPFFIDYLQLLVDHINSNISILNEDLTEFDLDLIYMKNLENYLINTYNKNLIYNDIINGYISKHSINNEIINKFYKKIMIHENNKNYVFTSYLFKNVFDTYKNNLENIDINNVKKKIMKLILDYNSKELELFEHLSNIVKYIILEKKLIDVNDNKNNIKSNKFVIDDKYLIKEFDLFLKLKQHLINAQNEFIKKYPRNSFYK